MTTFRLILSSLRFHARTHLGVVAGVALASAILTGALVVGDSVRITLRKQALARLGGTVQALTLPDSFCRAVLADKLARSSGTNAAPVLLLNGTATLPDNSARAGGVQIVGGDAAFWQIGGLSDPLAGCEADEAVVNARLARQLGIETGATIVVRTELPSFVPRDAPLSGRSDQTRALRVRVRAILDDDGFGRFGLQAGQIPPANLFVPLAALQEHVHRPGRANVILSASTNDLAPALRESWTLDDADLEVRPLPDARGTELRSARVFLDRHAGEVALGLASNAAGVLTYFATELRQGSNATPYSFVTATGPGPADNAVAINPWLAGDLAACAGDEIAMRFYAIGDRRELRETQVVLHVAAVLPTQSDGSWMPAFPGLSGEVDCRKWDPGIPIDTTRIRPKDEAYWKELRGTPKAFVSLATGQRLWANRFGEMTAVRFPGTNDARQIAASLRTRLDPSRLGLFFTPVRERALQAGAQALDFGQLFIGLSFFLIAAALALAAMLFVFSVQQRHAEAGLLRALGFTRGRVARLLLSEGVLLASAGSIVGAPLGLLYAGLALRGLGSVWSGAVAGARVDLAAGPATFLVGPAATLISAWLALAFAQRRQLRRPAAELLARAGELELDGATRRRWPALAMTLAGLAVALVLALGARGKSGAEAAEGFFGAGASLLIAGLGGLSLLLNRIVRSTRPSDSIVTVGRKAAARRPGRSLTSAGVLASGLFLVLSIGAFQHDAKRLPTDRNSGTGGFALYARSALPIHDDLNAPAGRAVFGIDEIRSAGVSVVPLRVREGDEASCLNLNRAQQPTLWGVEAKALRERGAFSFASPGGDWSLLDAPCADGAVPAIADQQTVLWALGRKLGDELVCTDEQGRPFRIRIVGLLAPSILQGGLLMASRDFTARFPSSAGCRLFLIDAPRDRTADVSAEWTRALVDRGFEAVPAPDRLADFLAVENTYLAIFQVLGGLGVVLGAAGFGIAAIRNGYERRNELVVLRAMGFEVPQLRRMLAAEQRLLLLAGLLIGGAAAVLALLPDALRSGAAFPVWRFASAVAGLAGVAALSVRIAARAALRRTTWADLRTE